MGQERGKKNFTRVGRAFVFFFFFFNYLNFFPCRFSNAIPDAVANMYHRCDVDRGMCRLAKVRGGIYIFVALGPATRVLFFTTRMLSLIDAICSANTGYLSKLRSDRIVGTQDGKVDPLPRTDFLYTLY